MKTQPNSPRRTADGFSLIEMLAVLAVMVVLALAIAPAFINRFNLEARQQESRKLSGIAQSAQSLARRQGYLPHPSTFNATVALQAGMSLEQIAVNSRQIPRVIVSEADVLVGPFPGGGLPYQQGVNGSIRPQNARMMIISSMNDPLPSGLASGPMAKASFDAIWEAKPNTVPAGWNWSGLGDDLRIQRINWATEFVELSLNNVGPDVGRYMFDSATNTTPSLTNSALPIIPFVTWVVKGTKVSLHSPAGSFQASEIINESISFVCDHGVWRAAGLPAWTGGAAGHPFADRRLNGSDVQAAANLFLAVEPKKPGTNHELVVQKAITFFRSYLDYAGANFSNSKKNAYNQGTSGLHNALGDWD